MIIIIMQVHQFWYIYPILYGFYTGLAGFAFIENAQHIIRNTL